MSELIAFLHARLDEDEQAEHDRFTIGPIECPSCFSAPGYTMEGGSPVVRCLDGHDVTPQYHAALIPAPNPRVLREVEAKRQMIDATLGYEAIIDGEWDCGHRPEMIAAGLCREINPDEIEMLRLLAFPYSNHPDWLEEWRPVSTAA